LPHRVKYRRHQVVELPEIRPVVTEYQLHARRCRCCGRRTWATLPPGVKGRCVGPRVQAITAILSGACRLSRRQVQTLLADLFGVKIALGTDSAVAPHTQANKEVGLMVSKGGMTPRDALIAATKGGADLLNISNERGRWTRASRPTSLQSTATLLRIRQP